MFGGFKLCCASIKSCMWTTLELQRPGCGTNMVRGGFQVHGCTTNIEGVVERRRAGEDDEDEDENKDEEEEEDDDDDE